MIHDFLLISLSNITNTSVLKINNKYLFTTINNIYHFHNGKHILFEYQKNTQIMCLPKLDYSYLCSICLTVTENISDNIVDLSSLKKYNNSLTLSGINIKNPPLNICSLKLYQSYISDFSIFQKLTRLLISYCYEAVTINHLPQLKLLILHDCSNINIDSDINVSHLVISRCPSIKKINMSKLRKLTVCYTDQTFLNIGKKVKYLHSFIWCGKKNYVFENKNIMIKKPLYDEDECCVITEMMTQYNFGQR